MATSTSEIGVAVIGTGLFGQTHIRVYQSIPRVKVVAICDIHLAQAQTVATEFHVPIATNRLDEVLSNPEICGISVVTPETHHREPVIKALEAGKGVLCEKPLATNLDDARAMCDAAKRTGGILMPAHVLRFASKIVRARKGSGPSTITSRRSGNVESQLSTANRPTTSIVVAIRKCSVLHA